MRKLLYILLFSLICFRLSAQNDHHKTEIYFELDRSSIDPALSITPATFRLDFNSEADPNISLEDVQITNDQNLANLANTIIRLQNDPNATIVRIEIDSWASPEGGRSYNKRLAAKRSEVTREYLMDRFGLEEDLFVLSNSGIAWDELEMLVEASSMRYRDDILHIIRNVEEETWRRINPSDPWLTLVDSRTKQLKELHKGVPYRYLFTYIFPQLRKSNIVTVYYKMAAPTILPLPTTVESNTPAFVEQSISSIYTPLPIECPATTKSYPFAVKSNLLYDAVTVLNVELEIPIKEHWSVAGEWIFPWWTWDDGTSQSKRNCLQLLNANIEGKYWFGDRTDRPQLTGWFTSLYAGGGLYDFERDAKGYQGEFFIAAGIGVGYAHTINKSGSLRMEYSTGIGYLKTNYRYYESIYDIDSQWHAIRQLSGNYTWFGPTRGRISLVWYLSPKKRGGAQ